MTGPAPTLAKAYVEFDGAGANTGDGLVEFDGAGANTGGGFVELLGHGCLPLYIEASPRFDRMSAEVDGVLRRLST